MSDNILRNGVERGEIQIGTWVTMIRNPAIVPLLKAAGMDFVRVDMEHAAMSIETIADMAVVARALDLPMVVRPPMASREWITALLDIGIWNILCPQVETAQQAAAIVAASRYAPMGSRGVGGLSAATDFQRRPTLLEQRSHANSQVFVTVMLETAGAFDHLHEIAAMDGIDAITLGPGDLAQDLGIAGMPEEGEIVEEKRAQIVAACKRHGKASAMLVANPEKVREYRAAGVSLFTYLSDVDILATGFSQAAAQMRSGTA